MSDLELTLKMCQFCLILAVILHNTVGIMNCNISFFPNIYTTLLHLLCGTEIQLLSYTHYVLICLIQVPKIQYELTMEDYERDRQAEEERVAKMLSNSTQENPSTQGTYMI